MIRNKAFTLIEVMLAMGVLTMSVFFISEIMLKSLVRLQDNQDKIEKVYYLKRELYSNLLKKPLPEKKVITKLETPEITLATDIVDLRSKSSLKEYKKHLRIIQTNAFWKKDAYFRESDLTGFVFKPNEKEVKK